MKRSRKDTLVKTIVAWTIALVWILPLMGVVMTAIRPFSEVINGWWKLEPFNATLSNFSVSSPGDFTPRLSQNRT
ncbi:hypothetical protein [Mesotoga sp.]|uniref:hypothetical protein n=1 Tax=Mesotoga sp. TaxID=2053577 RepID=UPI00345F0E7D